MNNKRPPPGFQAKQQPAALDMDEAALSSMFRMALDDTQDTFFAQQQRFQQDLPQPPQQQGFYAPPPQQFAQPPPPRQQLPPPALFFTPPPPFVFQPEQQQQQQHNSPQANGRFNDYKYMKGREIAQIVRNQLRQVETGDEYADDYYFLQFQNRDVNLQRQPIESFNEVDEERSVLTMLKSLHEHTKTKQLLPLPALKPKQVPVTPVQQDTQRAQNALQLQMKWFDKTNVLGRTLKSNIRTPKELIALDNNDATTGGKCFASRGWELRQISLDVANALGQVKDVTQLLLAKRNAMQASGQQGWEQVRVVLKDLESQREAACVLLAKQMGLLDSTSAGDETLVNLLWLPKGRRLALEASEVLLPNHQKLFLQAGNRLMVYFACTTPTAQAKKNREGLELDQKAAQVLKRMLTSMRDLTEVKECFQLLLRSNTAESLAFIVATPGGAEVVKTMLFHGQALADAQQNGDAEWAALFQEFIDMAERGIGARE